MASRAHATLTVPGTIEAAEACWYDTSGWPKWIDGLAEVVGVEGPWPGVGATVTWDSYPAGRGRVTERVVSHLPGSGQTVEVTDASITGRQEVTFMVIGEVGRAEPAGPAGPVGMAGPAGTARTAGTAVQVELSLEYALARASLLTPLVDMLFIRRAMARSLQTTLARFGVQLAGRAEAGQH